MGAGLHLRTEHVDGAAVDVFLPLPEGRDAKQVKTLLDKLLKLGAK
jgi:hypothetical protein